MMANQLALKFKILHNLACKGGAISLLRVGQLTYKGVPSCKTPLQASDKQHTIQPRFFDHKSFKFDIFQRYILDTFLLIRELKSVTPLQASKHLPYKQGYVVLLFFTERKIQFACVISNRQISSKVYNFLIILHLII
ncbi:Hypothetical_protein [Hexamita inflata]|uniref:Hypothetical_protein n=1 Tax=Hexamita inflata TaxID=28002 RepID=A0ABP1H6J9_9EUKA